MADTTTWTPISAPTDFQDDAVFNIDFKTKTVQVLVEQPIVAGENLSQFIKFQAPRFYDNIDLTNMSVNILYVSPAGNKGISAAVNTEYSEDMIRCGWLVPYAACPQKGTLLFVLEFVGADYVLKTTIGSTPVLDSINDADVIPEPVEQAWYITLQANVSAALQEAQTALGRIESIFNALGTPMAADTAAEMVDESAIYVYTGSEPNYEYGYWYYHDGTEWHPGGEYASTALYTDQTPTQGSTNAVSSGGVYEEISTINDDLESISGEIDDVNSAFSVLQDTVANMNGVPTSVRNAICVLCKKAVYTETGLLDELAVIESWASDITAITLNHTEATLNAETLQLIAVTVPEGGTITWQSNNTSVATVSSSGLVTPVSNGSVNIVAISGNAIATCSITVTGMKSLTGITATYTQSKTVYYTDSLAVLTSDLIVVASYDDRTSRTLSSNEYVLSGTLVEGTSTITVTYGGYTATFSVVVTGDYTQYTKIIATGEQYINTGLSEADLDGCSFEYKVNPTHSTGSSGHLFSSNDNFVAYPQVRGATALIHLIFAKLKGTERTSADNIWTEGTDITVVAYADSNNSVSMNGTTVIESVPAGSTTPSASDYYVMFGYAGAVGSRTYRFKGALYYFKIYNSDGTLIHHYVPVVENSTGIAGLRDLITDTFYSSATSTAFTVE